MARTAADLTFIRTQADSLSWAVLAVDALAEMGVLEAVESRTMRRIARRVIQEARHDPKFVGSDFAMKQVEDAEVPGV